MNTPHATMHTTFRSPRRKPSILTTSIATLAASLLLTTAHHSSAASASWLAAPIDGNWEPAVGPNWSTGTNTFPGATSGNASPDVATFNVVSTITTIVINNGAPSLNIAGITFTGSAANYTIGSTAGESISLTGGGTIQIDNALTATNAVETINAPLLIAGGTTYNVANDSANGAGAGAGTLVLGGTIRGGSSGAAVLTLAGTNTNANAITGVIGDGAATSMSVVKNGPGTWTLSGANTYTGSTTVNAGTLRAGIATQAFGIGSAVTIGATGTLDLNGFSNTIGSLATASTGIVDNTASGAATLTLGDSTSTTFAGSIQNTGGTLSLVKNGTGTLALTGDNTFAGSFTINNGIVTVQSATGAAISGDRVIIGDGVAGHTAVLRTSNAFNNIYNNAEFAFTTIVTIDNNGTLDLNSFHESIGSIASAPGIAAGSGLGTISLGAAGFLNVGINNLSTTFNGTITGTGAGILTKLGTGAWTLTSASTYSGATNINAGTLLANNTVGSATGTSTVTINSGGTLGGKGAVSGAITLNSGGFIAPGAAATGISTGTLKGTSLTWNGGGQINLQIGTSSDLLQLTGALTKGTAGTFGVELTDAGGIFSQSHYQLATFASTTFVAGDFTLAPTSFAGLTGVFTLKGTELDFDITLLPISGPIIQNSAPVNTPTFADFIVQGPVTTGGPTENNTIKTLTFTPGGSLLIHNTLFVTQGPVILVDGSSITLDGNLSVSQLQMLFGSLLNGNGSIIGDLVNAGLVSPGNSPGQIHVTGNYTQTPTGTLRIEIGGRDLSQHDLLSVAGTANLDGTLQLVRLNNFKLKRHQAVSFLTAEGGVTGRFAMVESAFTSDTILEPTVVYHQNSVALEAVQGSFEQFAESWGLTRNQKSVAKALDSVTSDRRANSLIDYLDQRKLTKLPGDFDKIAPEELTSIFTIGVSLAGVQSLNVQRRTDDIRSGTNGFSAAGLAFNGDNPAFSGLFQTGVAGPTGGATRGNGKEYKNSEPVGALPDEQKWGAFLSGTGEWVSVGNTENARGYDLTSGGFTLGVDYKCTPNFAIGVAAGYTGSSADLVDRGRVYVNGGQVGLYATFFQNEQAAAVPMMSKDAAKAAPAPAVSTAKGFYADVAVFGGYNSYDTRRSALQGQARGETDGGELNALFGAGYDFKAGGLTFGPTATFNYTNVSTNGFTEHGSLAPLDVHGGTGESLRSAFGLKASYDWKCGGILIKPEIRAAWQHEYGDAAYALDSSFANGAGNSFLVNGPQLGRDSALIGAGIAIQFNERMATYFYYDGELGRKNYESNSVTGGVRVAF